MVVKRVEEFPFFDVAGGYGFACDPRSTSKDGRPTSDFGWEVYPEGLREALELVSRYGLPLLITENGIADSRDALRPKFLAQHVAVLEEAFEEGVPVNGYMHWALTDNYEWAQGFRMRFGLIEVDLKTKRRIRRKSAYVYREIVKEGGVSERLKREYLS